MKFSGGAQEDAPDSGAFSLLGGSQSGYDPRKRLTKAGAVMFRYLTAGESHGPALTASTGGDAIPRADPGGRCECGVGPADDGLRARRPIKLRRTR